MVELKGITWAHARGFAPLTATAAEFNRRHRDISIQWRQRSLQAFGDADVRQLAEENDLIVIDHPHVGEIAASGCVVPLDGWGRERVLLSLEGKTVGGSHESYHYGGHQWALAIDAAAHVSAYRPDLTSSCPVAWGQILEMARGGGMLWPLKPVDSLMSFFTLCANFGKPCSQGIDHDTGRSVLEYLCEAARLLPAICLTLDPPRTLDLMSESDQYVYCPLLFGYSNYARHGFRRRLIRFANIPFSANGKPRGAILGGCGLAISAGCKAMEAAMEYAFEVAGPECQRGLYVESGGQPAHMAAWDDSRANLMTHCFFRDTRATLDRSWVRPRFAGYVNFQVQAGEAVHACLRGNLTRASCLSRLEQLYATSSGVLCNP